MRWRYCLQVLLSGTLLNLFRLSGLFHRSGAALQAKMFHLGAQQGFNSLLEDKGTACDVMRHPHITQPLLDRPAGIKNWSLSSGFKSRSGKDVRERYGYKLPINSWPSLDTVSRRLWQGDHVCYKSLLQFEGFVAEYVFLSLRTVALLLRDSLAGAVTYKFGSPKMITGDLET